MTELTTAAETESGKPASDFLCTAISRCDVEPVVVVLEDGHFCGVAACAEHVDEVKSVMTSVNRVWKKSAPSAPELVSRLRGADIGLCDEAADALEVLLDAARPIAEYWGRPTERQLQDLTDAFNRVTADGAS